MFHFSQDGDIADEILKSLREKHKPVDTELLEQQQKQHVILPPHNADGHEDANEELKKVDKPTIDQVSHTS